MKQQPQQPESVSLSHSVGILDPAAILHLTNLFHHKWGNFLAFHMEHCLPAVVLLGDLVAVVDLQLELQRGNITCLIESN